MNWSQVAHIAVALAFALPGGAAVAAKPHVHGVGVLQLVVEGNRLHVELSLPAMDIVGFEHTPKTAEQRAAVTQAAALLKNSRTVFEPAAAAKCVAASGQVSSALLKEQRAADHDHGHADEEIHADFDVTYRVDCRRPEALTSLKINIFRHLTRLEKLEVQSVMPNGQKRQQLAPEQHTITLP